jgi:acyl carrier protein
MIAQQSRVSSTWTEVRLRAIIAHVARVSPESFGPNDNLRTTLSLDSLSTLRIAAAVEREFDVTIPDDKLHELSTLSAIVRTLEGIEPAMSGGA